MEEYVLLIGGGIAVVAIVIGGIWLNSKLKPLPSSSARNKSKATAKDRKKAKKKKGDKSFQDSGKVMEKNGSVMEDTNLYKMKEGKNGLYRGDDDVEDDGQYESWDKYG